MRELSTWIDQLVDAVQEMLARRGTRPQATYRIQFHKQQMTFRDAAAIVPYLSRAGHQPPLRLALPQGALRQRTRLRDRRLQQLEPRVGQRRTTTRRWSAALRDHGMGQILDIVPNHMCVASDENPWWNDVLENGPSSPYAAYFDIDWKPVKEELREPDSPAGPGRTNTARSWSRASCSWSTARGLSASGVDGRSLPLDPQDLRRAADPPARRAEAGRAADSAGPARIGEHPHRLGAPARTAPPTAPPSVAERQREKEVIKDRLQNARRAAPPASPSSSSGTSRSSTARPDDPHSFDRLDKLLDAQVYRLSHWKAAADEINYRRFFDINDLAAVCTEDPEVFEREPPVGLRPAGPRRRGRAADRPHRRPVRSRRSTCGGCNGAISAPWAGRLSSNCGQVDGRRRTSPTAVAAEDGRRWEDIEVRFSRRSGTGSAASIRPRSSPPDARQCFRSWNERSAGENRSPSARSGVTPAARRCRCTWWWKRSSAPRSRCPSDWPVAGTTGYDFLNSRERAVRRPRRPGGADQASTTASSTSGSTSARWPTSRSC